MNKPSNERRELHGSAKELGATELDAVIGGITFFEAINVLLKAQTEVLKSISQNFR